VAVAVPRAKVEQAEKQVRRAQVVPMVQAV